MADRDRRNDRDYRQSRDRGDPRQEQYRRDPREDQYRGDPRQDQYRRDPREDQYRGDPRQDQYRRDYREDPYRRDPGQRGGGKPARKGSAVGTFFSTLLLVVAIGVFCYAGWRLLGYYRAYKAGSDEYANLNQQYVSMDSGEAGADEKDEKDEDNAPQTQETEPAAQVRSTEYVPEEHGEIGRPGKILKKVEELENPKTVEKKIEEAATVETEENQEKKQLPVMRNPINFKELNAINPEVIGWIRIGALNKSYPVAQAKDNDFYLHRTFEKKDNFAGCIFLNCENSKYFTDQNSIIYGHNMKDGSMFGTLKNFGDQETYDKNPYFWVFTPKLIYQYQIFSCSIVSRVGDPYRTRFLSSEFEAFLETCVENSQIDAHGLKLSKDDRIVTLSTCTGDESTRFIAQGVLKQVYLSVG